MKMKPKSTHLLCSPSTATDSLLSGFRRHFFNVEASVKRYAFTLVELLIVLLLMGIIYALAFNYIMPKSDKESATDLSLENITSLFRSSPLYMKRELSLYCMENGECLLSSEGEIEGDDIKLRSSGIAYIVTPDETLRSIDYPHMKIENREFKPRFSLRCKANGLFDPLIVRVDERWFYIHPLGKVYDFSDPVTMISFMRQSDYLPDRAGYAQ